jgi:hypothetical protein
MYAIRYGSHIRVLLILQAQGLLTGGDHLHTGELYEKENVICQHSGGAGTPSRN